MYTTVLLLGGLVFVGTVYGEFINCPNNVPISPPCFYRDQTSECNIICDGTGSSNITAVLTNLNQRLPTDTKPFSLEFQATGIVELPARAFGGIQFVAIYITYEQKLQRIHQTAFDGTISTLKQLHFSYSTISELANNETDLFGAIGTLKALESLVLAGTRVKTLHPMSVSSLRNLGRIIFAGNPLNSIFTNAFYNLPALRQIDFRESPIEHVGEHAFTINPTPTDKNLVIYFYHQQKDPFVDRSLELIGGATTIYFYRNYLSFLNQKKFENFLNENVKNTVIEDNINCTDSRNQWIKERHANVWHDLRCI